MSLVFAPRSGFGLMLGVGLSLVAHGGVVAALLARPLPAPMIEERGLKGREFIDLAPVEMLLAAPDTDMAEGDVSQDSAAQTESAEKTEETKASNDPMLAQVPYEVKDPELQFRLANPDEQTDATKEATEIATKVEEQTHTEFAVPTTAASPAASAGQDEQSGSTETEMGLSDDDKAPIENWQKDLVLAIAAAKTYPKAARKARAVGKVVVAFRLDGYGRILSREVVESSGWPVLDKATLAMFDGFDRLPAPPAAMGKGPFDMQVPVSYSLK